MPYFTANQHRLFYREQGNGPLLLILHGNTASSALHQGELDYFSRRYHAVALDFHGCGKSERCAVWQADWWQQGARDAATLVAHLGYERASVIGTSGGAIAALWMAILRPEHVQQVVADSCVEKQPQGNIARMLAERHRFTAGQIAFWTLAHGDDWEQVVRADSDLLRRFDAGGGDWFGGRLREIRCPVLFTASLRDNLLPDVGAQLRGMALQVAESRVFLTEEGDHPLMWNRPVDFRRAADAFMEIGD